LFKDVLNSYLRLSTLVDDSLLSESFSSRWLVLQNGSTLGRFAFSVVVCFREVCPIFWGLYHRRSVFGDGDV
jgi:hypothetical protein